MNAANCIRSVARNADELYGGFSSTHEAYGVIAEELFELLDAIQSNNLDRVRCEAIDVAAAATRLALQLDHPSLEFIQRSGAAPSPAVNEKRPLE
jgi:NTP pyrophosphatase (non-canonical NTP hydrolase)